MDKQPKNVAAETQNLKNALIQSNSVSYSVDKDFYEGIGGELRFNAEGLHKKAKEKGISIKNVEIIPLARKSAEFPGIGNVDLPAYIARVIGEQMSTEREIADVKQIDYFNMYQKYVANRLEIKNSKLSDNIVDAPDNKMNEGKKVPQFFLTDWERFEIGKAIIEDKEFGLEKTVTGACDRVIRKLMGENDWLYLKEAEMLESEFNDVNRRKQQHYSTKSADSSKTYKRASERQKNYLKMKIKNAGLNPDSKETINRVVSEMGFTNKTIDELSMAEMSKVIESIPQVLPKLREQYQQNIY